MNRCQNYVHFLLYLGYYLMAKYDRSGMYGAVSSPYQESDRKICLNFWFNMYNVSLLYTTIYVKLKDNTVKKSLRKICLNVWFNLT